MYADNIAVSKIISSPTDYSYLQEDINSPCLWITNNYLILNLSNYSAAIWFLIGNATVTLLFQLRTPTLVI